MQDMYSEKFLKSSIKLLRSLFLVMFQTFFYWKSAKRVLGYSKGTWRALVHSGTRGTSFSRLCAHVVIMKRKTMPGKNLTTNISVKPRACGKKCHENEIQVYWKDRISVNDPHNTLSILKRLYLISWLTYL